MKRKFSADGDDWLVSLDRHAPHPGVRAIVFHCVSDSQRPYHVTEVPIASMPNDSALEDLPESRLEELFADSEPMDFTHEGKAHEEHVADQPEPPGT